MKRLMLIAIIAGAIVPVACSKRPSGPTDEIVMHPVSVGEKTDLYEVVAPNELKLAEGVRAEIVDGHLGKRCAMVLRKKTGRPGDTWNAVVLVRPRAIASPQTITPNIRPAQVAAPTVKEFRAAARYLDR